MLVSFLNNYTVCSESHCALRLRYIDLAVSTKLPLKCAVVSLYSGTWRSVNTTNILSGKSVNTAIALNPCENSNI
jgi:hypothetical protein